MVNTMGWNERSDPDMRTANFCDVYREGVYTLLVVGLHKINVRVCFAAPLNTCQAIDLRHSVRASTNRSTALLAGRLLTLSPAAV